MRLNPRTALGSCVILAAGIALALRVGAPAPHAEEKEEHKPEAEPLPVSMATVHSASTADVVPVTGTLRSLPNGESRVAAQVSGRVQRVLVQPGQSVAMGALLVTINRPDLGALVRGAEAGLREAEHEVTALHSERTTRSQTLMLQERRAAANREAARSHLELLRAGSRPEEIAQAEAGLQAAEADLERLRNGSRPQEIAQAEAMVRDARANRTALQKDAARKSTLFEQGIVAARDVERSAADLAAAESTLETRLQALSLLRAGTRPEEIRVQEQRVREAQATLQLVRAGRRSEEIREGEAAVVAADADLAQARAAREEVRSLDQRLRSAAARVDAAREQLRIARATAARVEVRSPLGGEVAQVLVGPGDGVTEQGPVVVIRNRDAYRAVLDVPPARRGAAAPGTPAEIHVAGLPDAGLRGTVRSLLGTASPETGLLTAEVWLTDPGHRLAEGMAVQARLLPRGRARRLLVPTSAVLAREGESFVYRIVDDEVHQQTVELGREHGTDTEIVRGLSEGDHIVRDGSLSLADGTAVVARP